MFPLIDEFNDFPFQRNILGYNEIITSDNYKKESKHIPYTLAREYI